jgi:hypothetical protein
LAMASLTCPLRGGGFPDGVLVTMPRLTGAPPLADIDRDSRGRLGCYRHPAAALCEIWGELGSVRVCVF